MKKIAIILMALIFISFLFTSCQKAKESEGKKEVQVQQTQKEKVKQPSEARQEVKPEEQKQPSVTPETKEKPVEIKDSPLTEKEQKEFEGGLEGEITFKEALTSLKILIKGDYTTIRWYQEWGKKYNFGEKNIRDRYETDLCATVKKIAEVKSLPVVKAKAIDKPLPALKLKDEFDLTLKVIEIKTSSPKTIACAAEAIGWYQDKRAIPVLKELIENKDPEIRLQSAGSLLMLDEGNTALPVIDKLVKTGIHQSTFALEKLFAWEVRKEFGEKPVISHTKLWDERGKEILIRALGYSSDEVKGYAALRLAEMGREKEMVQNVSIKILERNKWKESPDRRANYYAISAIEIIKSEKAITILNEIINNPDTGYISNRAREALKKIESQSSIE